MTIFICRTSSDWKSLFVIYYTVLFGCTGNPLNKLANGMEWKSIKQYYAKLKHLWSKFRINGDNIVHWLLLLPYHTWFGWVTDMLGCSFKWTSRKLVDKVNSNSKGINSGRFPNLNCCSAIFWLCLFCHGALYFNISPLASSLTILT